MKRSPNAIRYIDPSWDNTSEDGLLYPGLFYRFGFADRAEKDYVDDIDELDQKEEPAEATSDEDTDNKDDDEVSIEDRIWTQAIFDI